MNINVLKNDEKAIFSLRELYRKYGYSQFKMSKFEEYDLYVRNKEFLVSDSVITFTDTNGRLMALKPDVTLSIVKNTDHTKGVQRLYYNENVYRVSDKTHAYKEILQTGLECIGDLDTLNLCEVLYLAAKSLETVSADCALNISHLGVTSALLEQEALRPIKRELMGCIGEKNSHGITALCQQQGVGEQLTEQLRLLTQTYGPACDVLPRLEQTFTDSAAQQAINELKIVTDYLEKTTSVRVWVDFSLVSNMNYYNGLVFRGFVKGVPTGVLSGGQYDNLMKRMHKNAKAIGFAVYLDLLEHMEAKQEFDVDVLLTYTQATPIEQVLAKAAELTAQNKRVSIQKQVPEGFAYREWVQLD